MDLPYKQYFNAIPGYLTVQNRDLKIITANARFQRDFGEYEGRCCYQVYKQRPEQCAICPVMRTFHDGQRHHSEEVVTCLDGSLVCVLVYTEPIYDAQGGIAAVLEMSTDITEVKALQHQYRLSQERYRQLFEDVPCYISIQDQDMRITDCNSLFRRDFGTSYGRKCHEIYKRRKEECFPCMVRDTFNDGRLRVHEEVVTSLEGKPINVLVHTAPVRSPDGAITSVIEMSANITKLRELQSQLTSIGLLISSISHGLKGLINGLDGGIYLVNNGLQKGNQERVQKGWEIVVRNVNRIRSMVLDILYYAKDREPNWEKLAAATLLEEVHGMIAEKAKDQGVDVSLDLTPDVGDFEGDAKAIRTLLINLAENSLDACRVDKQKEHHALKLSLKGSIDHVTFQIEDNGIGMDRETREKAFTLFFSSKGSEGTGLGLFVSNKIALAHGGHVTLESEENQGTRFIISLPRNRPLPKVENSEKTAPPGGTTKVTG